MARVTADQVADFIIRFAHEYGDCITNLKLQKLLYYAQGWFLALNDGEPLFDEHLEAWVHGPVHPGVYHRFKRLRWDPISCDIDEPQIPADVADHLREVLDAYGPFSAYQLELMTHREDPWINARDGLAPDEPSQALISHPDMQKFFSSIE